MAYNNQYEFIVDFKNAWDAPDDEAITAYVYYCAGLRLGRDGVGLSIGLVEMLKKSPEWQAGGPNEAASVLRNPEKGKLFITDKPDLWKIQFNDAFILGGVHSKGQFKAHNTADVESTFKSTTEFARYALEGYNQLDFYTDNKDFPLRVTQREMAGLIMFGYDNTVSGKDTLFNCVDPVKADQATCQAYKNGVPAWEGR